jgi:HEAT repeat protein
VAERIEAVLARILADTPYAVHYELSGRGRGVLLARLVIGEPEVKVAVGRKGRERTGGDSDGLTREERKRLKNEDREARRADKVAREESRGPKRELSDAEWRRAHEERLFRQQVRREENLLALDDLDPAEREFGVFSLDATDPGDLIYLGEALRMDPNPLVREEAASQLGFGEPSAVLPLLRMALEDPSSDVLLAALDSIGFVGDPSIIRDLMPLLEHPEAAIRDEVRGLIDFLESS